MFGQWFRSTICPSTSSQLFKLNLDPPHPETPSITLKHRSSQSSSLSEQSFYVAILKFLVLPGALLKYVCSAFCPLPHLHPLTPQTAFGWGGRNSCCPQREALRGRSSLGKNFPKRSWYTPHTLARSAEERQSGEAKIHKKVLCIPALFVEKNTYSCGKGVLVLL